MKMLDMSVTEEDVNNLSMSTKAIRNKSNKYETTPERKRVGNSNMRLAQSSSLNKLVKTDAISPILKRARLDESRQLHYGLA